MSWLRFFPSFTHLLIFSFAVTFCCMQNVKERRVVDVWLQMWNPQSTHKQIISQHLLSVKIINCFNISDAEILLLLFMFTSVYMSTFSPLSQPPPHFTVPICMCVAIFIIVISHSIRYTPYNPLIRHVNEDEISHETIHV